MGGWKSLKSIKLCNAPCCPGYQEKVATPPGLKPIVYCEKVDEQVNYIVFLLVSFYCFTLVYMLHAWVETVEEVYPLPGTVLSWLFGKTSVPRPPFNDSGAVLRAHLTTGNKSTSLCEARMALCFFLL